MHNMEQELRQQLTDAADRLTQKNLFGRPGDSMSLRIPGTQDWMWVTPEESTPQVSGSDQSEGRPQLHDELYRHRSDAGALLFSTTTWSEQLAALQKVPPTLFDEPARHIGPVAKPVRDGDKAGLLKAVERRSNVAVYGSQLLRIGMTTDRVIFNTELFEKCAMAFVIADSSGRRIRTVPGWVRYIAGGRLQKDQKRATESYAEGRIPEGMNNY